MALLLILTVTYCVTGRICRGDDSLPSIDALATAISDGIGQWEAISIKGHSKTAMSRGGTNSRLAKTEEFDLSLAFTSGLLRIGCLTTYHNSRNANEGPFRSETLIDGQQLLQITFEDEEVPRVAAGEKTVTSEDWKPVVRSMVLAAPLGYLPAKVAGGYIPDILLELDCTVAQASEQSSLLISGTSQEHELQIEVRRESPSVVLLEKVVYCRPKESVRPGQFTRYEYEVVEFRTWDGVAFPASYVVRSMSPGGSVRPVYPDGVIPPSTEEITISSKELVKEVTLTHVSRSVFDDVRGKVDSIIQSIDEPVEAYIKSAPHLRHTLQEGRLIPDLASDANRLAESAEFRSEGRSWTRELVVLNLVVVALIVFYRFRSTAGPS